MGFLKVFVPHMEILPYFILWLILPPLLIHLGYTYCGRHARHNPRHFTPSYSLPSSSTHSFLYVVTHFLTVCEARNFTCCTFYWNIFRIIRVEKEKPRDSFPNQPKCLPHQGCWVQMYGAMKRVEFQPCLSPVCDVGKSLILSEPQFYPLRHGGHTTHCIGLWRIGGSSSESV